MNKSIHVIVSTKDKPTLTYTVENALNVVDEDLNVISNYIASELRRIIGLSSKAFNGEYLEDRYINTVIDVSNDTITVTVDISRNKYTDIAYPIFIIEVMPVLLRIVKEYEVRDILQGYEK